MNDKYESNFDDFYIYDEYAGFPEPAPAPPLPHSAPIPLPHPTKPVALVYRSTERMIAPPPIPGVEYVRGPEDKKVVQDGLMPLHESPIMKAIMLTIKRTSLISV